MEQIKRVNLIFLVTVILSLLASLFLGNLSFIRENPIANLLSAQILYFLPVVIYLAMGKDKIRDLLRIRKVSAPNVILLVVFAFFITPLLTFLNALSLLFTQNVITNIVTGIVTAYPLLAGIFVIALIPAVLEESIFRGVFFNEYRKVNPGMGVLLSGLLFGLMHMNFNQFIYAFVMGMILALLVEATDSLLASMIVHFTLNASSVFLSWTSQKLAGLAGAAGGYEADLLGEAQAAMTKESLLPIIMLYGCIAVVTTTICWFLLNGICKIAKRPDAVKNVFRKQEKGGRLITLPLAVGIAACLALMLYQQFMYY